MSENKQLTVKGYFESDLVREKFREVLGKKASAFLASMLSTVNSNNQLQTADPKSVYAAAMIAATLDLPINPNLGFAYIIPYRQKDGSYIAQFQMGYKGFIQLAQRSGQFKTLNVSKVCEGEIKTNNILTGEMEFDWKAEDRDKAPAVGYVAYMKLVNGFEKSLYMTVVQLKNHGLRYSQTAKKGYGLWEDNFDAMASKTVIKLLLSKYAPLTTEMQTAQLADQAIVKDNGEMEYIDNKTLTPEQMAIDKEWQRVKTHIANAKTIDELKLCEGALGDFLDEELNTDYDKKYKELSKENKKND